MIYGFLIKEFTCDDVNYSAAITPVLFPLDGDDGIEATSSITGIIISEDFGTRHFDLESWGDGEWVCTKGALSEAVAKEIISAYDVHFKQNVTVKLYRVEVPVHPNEN